MSEEERTIYDCPQEITISIELRELFNEMLSICYGSISLEQIRITMNN